MSDLVTEKGYSLSENQVKKYPEFNVNALKSRGWTRAMIKKHLGEPDRQESGRGTRGHLMSLYKKTRVFEAEAKEGWKKDAERAKERTTIGKKAWEEGGKKVWEKKVAARKESEKEFWDVSCFTPESVRQIYEEQREKDCIMRKKLVETSEFFKMHPDQVIQEYPEYDKATADEVTAMLCMYKEESRGCGLDKPTGRFIYAKILKHISGNIADFWGGSDAWDEVSKGEGFPVYASGPSLIDYGIPF